MRRGAIRSVIVVAGLALVGCGAESPPAAPNGSLDAVNRLSILQQVVATVIGGAGVAGPVARSGPGLLAGVSCEKSCDDATCVVTCPVDERLRCPAGGFATNAGTIEGTLDASETGAASLHTRQTYRDCRPRADLSVDGDPETTASGMARFQGGALAGDQSMKIKGAVRYASTDGSGRCVVDLDVTVSRDQHGAAHGTACGQPVDVTF